MEKFARTMFWLLTAWFFAYDLYLWGGLAVTPRIGNELRDQASVQSPLAATYLFLGRVSVDAAGRSAQAKAFAGERFPEQVADLESSRQMILTRFLTAQKVTGRLAYYGAPLLLLLSLFLHARRPKQLRSFGQKG